MKAASSTVVVFLVCFLSGVSGCSKKETPAPVVVSHSKLDPKPTPSVDVIVRAKTDADFPVDPKGKTPVDNDDYRVATTSMPRPFDGSHGTSRRFWISQAGWRAMTSPARVWCAFSSSFLSFPGVIL